MTRGALDTAAKVAGNLPVTYLGMRQRKHSETAESVKKAQAL